MTQVKAFTLEVEGTTKAIESLLQVEQAIAKNQTAIKNLKKESEASGKTLSNLTKENERLSNQSKILTTDLDAVNKRMGELLAQNKQASKEYKDLKESKAGLTEAIKKNEAELKKNNQSQDKHNKIIATSTTELKKYIKEQSVAKNQQSLLNREIKNAAKDFDAFAKKIPRDSIAGLNREYSKLIQQYELMSRAERKSAQGRELTRHLEQISREANEASLAVNNFKRNIGNYPGRNVISNLQGFGKSALAAFGVGSALFIGVGIIRNAAKTIVEFNKAQIELQSLSGQSAEQLQGLTDQAKELGRETLFTAIEVTKLQVELSKLGFSNNEIAAVTADIINFAVALDAEVAPAATVAASTMRAFGLEASEMQRIVSVLGVAANKTALSFEDFEGNIATFAPVARQFGFSLEDSITLFGKLRDAGFDASTAATALRNIFLKLADPNGDLAKRLGAPIKNLNDLAPALKKLKDQGIDLGEAFELTGERAVAAFGQLTADSGTLTDLRDSLTDVNEEFKVMVEKRLKSVDAQVKLTKAAWDGLILSIDEGDGKISQSVTGILESFRGFLGVITDINEGAVTMGAVFEDLTKIILGFATGGVSLFFSGSSIREQQETWAATERVIKTSVERIVKIMKDGNEEEKKLAAEKIKDIEAKAAAGDRVAKEFLKQYTLLTNGISAVVDDTVDNKIKNAIEKFAVGTIGFLEAAITKLNEVLKNTTDETVITTTTKQIIELEKQLKSLQDKLDEARNKLTPRLDVDDQLQFQNVDRLFGDDTLLNLFGENPDEEAARIARESDERERARLERVEADKKDKEDQLERQKDFNQILLDEQQQYNQAISELFGELGGILGDIFSDQEDGQKETFKKLLLLALKFAESQVTIAATTQNAIAAFAAVGNPLLLAKLALQKAIITGLISAAFGVMRGLVQSFEKGLEMGAVRPQDNDGKVKDGIPFKRPGSSDNVLVHAKVGERFVNKRQQENAERLYGPGVWKSMITGKHTHVPVANQLIRESSLGSAYATISDENIRAMAREVANEVGDAVETRMKGNRLRERRHKLK